jgi:hypothetical protein
MESEDPATAHVHAELTALTADFFHAVSFRQGERPDYSRLHALFIADGMLIRNSSEAPEVSTLDEFITPRQRMVESGELSSFEEVESAAITEVFGNVAHRLSTYEKRGTTNGQAFEGRGVISIQFIRTPQGWKMTSMAWDDERPGLTIPDRYR